MAWTTPASAAVGEVYTAAKYNTHTRDNFNALYPIARVTTAVTINNDATERTLVSQSIGANEMGTNRRLVCNIGCDWLLTAGTRSFTLRVKFGGTTLVAVAIGGIAADADKRPIPVTINLANLGATNSQFTWGNANVGGTDTLTQGIGGMGIFGDIPFASNGASAIDTTSAQTFEVTAQMSAADANLTFKMWYAALQIV